MKSSNPSEALRQLSDNLNNNENLNLSDMSTRSDESFESFKDQNGNFIENFFKKDILQKNMPSCIGLNDLSQYRKGKRQNKTVYEFDGIYEYARESSISLKQLLEEMKVVLQSKIPIVQFLLNDDVPTKICQNDIILVEARSKLTQKNFNPILIKKPDHVELLFEDLKNNSIEPQNAYMVIVHNGASPDILQTKPEELCRILPNGSFCLIGTVYFSFKELWKNVYEEIRPRQDDLFIAFHNANDEIKTLKKDRKKLRKENKKLKKVVNRLENENKKMKKDIDNMKNQMKKTEKTLEKLTKIVKRQLCLSNV